MTSTPTRFYVTGGTMPANALSYIKRQTDDELYHALQQGEYCSILDSSQMGKSSLVIRVMERLKQEGIKVIYFSLQPFGTTGVTLDNWYGSLLTEIDTQLELPTTALSFWDTQRQQNLTPTYCWDQVVRQIILGQCSQPIVFFLDEIGIVQKLPAFTDDFLLSLREFYNARTTYPDFRRLTFCLIGTATPASLIKDRHLPPFNVGKRIVLADFTETEVTSSLVDGLQHKATAALTLLQRVWHWTNGHPYLTQKLCEAVANDTTVTTAEGVDRVCQELFLASHRDKETNLEQIEKRVKDYPDCAALLELYRQIRGHQLPDDETQEKINALRLTGIIKVRENALWVRNPIYLEVFDNAWVEATLPEAEKRRQRAAYRHGLILASMAATGIIAAIGGGIYVYFDRYVWENVTYCNAYAKRFGIMQCVGELSTAQAHGREVSYKFIRKGRKNPVWKVQAVEGLTQVVAHQENSEFTKKLLESLQKNSEVAVTPVTTGETLTSSHNVTTYLESKVRMNRESQWEFVLDANGKVVYEKAYNSDNQLVWGLIYSPSPEGQPKQAHYVGANGFPQPPTDSGAEFVEFRYSNQGDEEEIHYFDRQDNPRKGPGKIFVKHQQFDGRGLRIEVRYFDSDGKTAMLNEDGYHKSTHKYDDHGNVIEEAYFGIDEQQMLLKDGYHKVTWKYDGRGKVSEEAVFGLEGQPTLLKGGYHKITWKYDDRGNLIEGAVFGLKGQPILLKEVRFHKITWKYDDRGNLIEGAVFGLKGQPTTLHKDGYHKFTQKFDDRGNVIEQAYFGTEGQPTLHKDGFHKFTQKFDDRGNVIEQAYFGMDGQPILLKDGYHKLTQKFDDRGNVIEQAYFGTEGQPILHKEGYHKLTQKYDDRGNVIELAYFGAEGQPTLLKDGFHKATWKYDDRGNVIEKTYFGIDGQPTLHKDGYHKITWKHDGRGNVVEVANFGLNGQPILHKNGYHKYTQKHDDRGNVIEQAYFGTEGQPILHKDGYHKFTQKFDDRGNVIELAYFGTEGQPILHKEGYHKFTNKYDDRDNLIEQANFGRDGQPILGKYGYHKFTSKYDDRGEIVEKAYFDAAGNLIHESSKQTGETETILVDVTGYLKEKGHYKTKGRYNERDQLISQAYFDEVGNPTTLFGLHSFTHEYDEQGNFLEFASFDIAGRPTLFKDGYHRFTRQEDKELHQIEWAYFDVEGKPAVSKLDGYHKLRQRNDERGWVIEKTYYDTAGNYLNKKFDSGNLTYQASFDALGNPTTTSDGFHKLTTKYDDKGNQLEGTYFDVTGHPLSVEVVVKLVTPDSQGEKLGIQAGDLFTHYEGKPLINQTYFTDRRETEPAEGPAKELKVRREGKELTLMVKPGELGVELENRFLTPTPN